MNLDTSAQTTVPLLMPVVDPTIISTGVALAKLAAVKVVSEGAPELALPTSVAFSTMPSETMATSASSNCVAPGIFYDPRVHDPRVLLLDPRLVLVHQAKTPQGKYLIESQYNSSSIEQQLATDNNFIVIERNIIDESVITETDGKQKSAVLIKERVIDRKYLEQGHITELIEKIRRGEIPTMNQVFLAIIDLTDLVTFKIFNPILSDAKLAITTEEPIYRLKELSAEVFSGSVEKAGATSKSEKIISVDVEKRAWYKLDKKTVTKDVVETSTKYKNDYIITNIKDITTKELKKSELDKLIYERNTKYLIDKTKNNYVSLENNLSLNEIQNIEKHTIALVKENVLTTVEDYTLTEKGYKRKFWRKATGVKIEKSDTDVIVKSQDEIKQYYVNDNINEDKLKHFNDASTTFASMDLVSSAKLDEQVVNKYTDLTKGVEFNEGWISYIPGGSIATIGVKADMGAKINGKDIFWAGVDVASIALAVVTLGASSGISATVSATTTTASVLGKTGAKSVVNVATKAISKDLIKSSTKSIVKPSLGKFSLKLAKEEVKIYQKANLKDMIINGKKCLVRNDIDLKFKDALNRTNLERMEQGLAPIEKATGQPYELHHVLQNPNGRLAQLTRSEHRMGENNKILHTIRKDSPVEHDKMWDIERAEHWKAYANEIKKN